MARFLNIRLDNISVEDPERHPHMVSVYILFFFFPTDAKCENGILDGEKMAKLRRGPIICLYL